MKNLYRFISVLAVVASVVSANAQNEGMSLSYLKMMPNSGLFNPGERVNYNAYFGLAVSNISWSSYNSAVKLEDMFRINNGVMDAITLNKFFDNLSEKDNRLNANTTVDIFNVGFRVKSLFVSLDCRVNFDLSYGFSKDFLGFFVRGNGYYSGIDNMANMDSDLDGLVYNEIGIGVQYDINKKLTVGVRPKLLAGILNIETKSAKANIYTDPENYNLIAHSVDFEVNTSSIFKKKVYCLDDVSTLFDDFDMSSSLEFTKNIGFGIDLGASYKLNDHVGFGASVLDLGFISWKDNMKLDNHINTPDTLQALFTNLDDVLNMDVDFESLLDDIVNNVFGNDSLSEGDDYTTFLNSRFVLNGYYEINNMARFTGTAQLITKYKMMYPSFTVAYSGEFFKFLNVTTNFTYSSLIGSAVGLGLGFHAGAFNFYAVTDNVLVTKSIFANSSDSMLTEAMLSTTSFRAGIVFSIGKYQRNKAVKIEESEEEL